MEAMMNHLALRFLPLMLLWLLAESPGGEGSATVAVDASESSPDDRESQKALAKLGGTLDWDGDDVWKIEFRGKPVTDADLEHLRGLHDLEILDLTGTKITDDALVKLAGQQRLRNLELDGTRVTDAGLIHLQKLPSLKFLSLNSTAVSDTGLAHLKSIQTLEGLDLNGTQVTDAGLVHIKTLPRLRFLELGQDAVASFSVVPINKAEEPLQLSAVPNITQAQPGRTRISDAGLVHIGHMKNLEKLELSGSLVTDAGLTHLKNLSKLEDLFLEYTQITDAGLAQLSVMSQLRWLWLEGTQVTDAGLAHLKKLKNLEMLILSDTQVTNAGLVHLEGLGKLDHLTLKNTRANEEGVKRLRKALPKLSWVEYDRPPFDRAGAEAANGILEKVQAGDLPGFSAIVEKDPTAVHLRWTGFYKGDDGDGLTALFFATRKGDLPMLKFLLAHGADAKAGNAIGDTPLHFAPTAEIATALIAAGADVGAQGNCGYTPLHYARTRGIAEVLLAHGAHVDAQSDVSGSVWGTQRSPDKKPSVRSTPLCWTARDGRLDVVTLLIEHGADVNADAQGGTPLYEAARGGHRSIVELLLAKGAQVNVADGRKPPLYGAAENGHADVVSLLISQGAQVNVRDKAYVPLHAALEQNHAQIVRALLDAGATVPAPDKQGWTLLHAAVLWGCGEAIVEMLVQAGVAVDAKTEDREPSFDLENGPPWERPPVTGRRTALHLAAEKGNLAAAQTLIAHGADIHAKTTAGESPLSLTAREEVYQFDPWFQGTRDAVQAWNEQRRREIETRNTNRRKIAELIRQTEKGGRRTGSR